MIQASLYSLQADGNQGLSLAAADGKHLSGKRDKRCQI